MVDEASETVRLDRSLIASALSSAPNPDRNVVLGGRSVAVVPVSGPPNASDLDRGRRPGTLRDLHELLKLAQSFDVIHLLERIRGWLGKGAARISSWLMPQQSARTVKKTHVPTQEYEYPHMI
jgi:trimethylamine:corrinoid methyltransferase-like protein